MADAHVSGSVVLPNGKVLMLGGRPPGASAPYLPVATYDPRTNTWQ